MAETKIKNSKTASKYHEAVGRRKAAVARVRLSKSADNNYVINNRDIEDYFSTDMLQHIIRVALTKSGGEKFSVNALIKGGGPRAQAEAMRLGIARALVLYNEEFRGELKRAGFLKRDPREKERKKFGLKKARKSPQWSKR